jgi:ATP-dependent DNA helicase RecQ
LVIKTREGTRVIDLLRRRAGRLVSSKAVARFLETQSLRVPDNPWLSELAEIGRDMAAAVGGSPLPARDIIDWLYESAGVQAREAPGRINLLTAHAAKGREFKHVFLLDCGDWSSGAADERRLYYVAMTRAKETLTLFHPKVGGNAFVPQLDGLEATFSLDPKVLPMRDPQLDRTHRSLGLGDVDIGFAGTFPPGTGPHRPIAALSFGDLLIVENRQILDTRRRPVGRLAKDCQLPAGKILRATVSAVVVRTIQQTSPQWQGRCKADRWETVLCDLTTQA